ncbi:MAG: hypothetical protein IKV23_08745 [Bacteroidaceae bacterium]|nr:hypothetical protein [Bacteroidaceae bacterium]
MKYSKFIALAAFALPMVAFAQTEITFENQDYKSLGVYDTWEESPFRTGKLSGNYAVIDNHLQYVDEQLGVAPNGSSKILAVQRSRYGSNTFGVRVDLNETFELTPATKYLHVKVYRPYGGRVMVVGLGKRTERMDQSPEAEQFWAMSTKDIAADKWQDVVLPIKGNGGIDIYSLVVVPDCESPHNYTEDAICYIDDIKVNDDPTSELVYGYYQTSMGEEQLYTRNDRRLNAVKLQVSGAQVQTITAPSSPNTVYVDMTSEQMLVKAGETVTASVAYTGGWMHAYTYIDYSNDGKFNALVNDDLTIAQGSDLMSFSFYGGADNENGINSAGTRLSGQSRNTLNMPSFTIPADAKVGVYRMRYKVDWNSIDPAGSVDQSNPILGNGGGIIDVMINVHGDYCNVNDANRNGEVLSAADGERLVTYQAPFGQDFRIKMNPENGFEYKGAIVKYGYNLQGDSVKNGNVQWQKVFFERQQFDENDEITIPAKYMCGDIEIEGLFIEQGTYEEPQKPTRYTVTTVEDGNFADGTTWYTIQIGQQGYVLSNNGNASYISLSNTVLDLDDEAQLWCFTGNDVDGYRLYNMEAGAQKVLASPVQMLGNTGSSSFPTMQPIDALPSGYTDLWNFENSTDLGSSDVAHAYMYEVGYPSNKVNNRDNRLAFWNGGADSGSTLQIYFAKVTTAIDFVTADKADGAIYDLTGRRVNATEKGIYIVGGKKVLVK